jgi:polysaccharide pyruvyl transferase WcaK-like protein/coenzyme F420-reducing hydrogenase beta subunit
MKAKAAGEEFGLAEEASYFTAFDSRSEDRVRSASGGILTLLLSRLLETGTVQGVLASAPVPAAAGSPHYVLRTMRTVSELDEGRSSHYHPICYTDELRNLAGSQEKVALVGLPCTMRAVSHLPRRIREKIKYTFCLVCGRGAKGGFMDCLAQCEGVQKGEAFTGNLRDKTGGIPDSNNFNIVFQYGTKRTSRNRYESAFTPMWRNYFFVPNCCYYCADFHGADADLSTKDAWGRHSGDPLGKSLITVRNAELRKVLEGLRDEGWLSLEECEREEVFESQRVSSRFKHIQIRDRIIWHRAIRKEVPRLGGRRIAPHTFEFLRLRTMSRLADWFHRRGKRMPVEGIIWIVRPLLALADWMRSRRPDTEDPAPLRVLIAGGYGYRNTGDEAELAANVGRWRRMAPGAEIIVLSPNPAYTAETHGVETRPASRVVFFDADRSAEYGRSSEVFRKLFFRVKRRVLANAHFLRLGLPAVGISERAAEFLRLLKTADVLHLSGGGYLTGRTLSRLWDNMLLIRLADVFRVSTILSGHTIGVFDDDASRKLARWGLPKARLVSVRDRDGSMRDLEEIGVKGAWEAFDDALFCEQASEDELRSNLTASGIDPDKPYAAVQLHDWGQGPEETDKVVSRFATLCDYIARTHGLQVLLTPLIPSDEPTERRCIERAETPVKLLQYNYDYRIVRAAIGGAAFCLTMKHHPIIFALGNAVPAIAVALEDYYLRKNAGALALAGLEEYALDRDAFYDRRAEAMIDRALSNRESIAEVIRRWLAEVKPRDGEVIRRFLSEICCRGPNARHGAGAAQA